VPGQRGTGTTNPKNAAAWPKHIAHVRASESDQTFVALGMLEQVFDCSLLELPERAWRVIALDSLVADVTHKSLRRHLCGVRATEQK
jgi:hypothetical protein